MLKGTRRELPSQHQLPRSWAAEMLTTVGEDITRGISDSGYSAREIGWALVRVFGATDKEAQEELIKGYQEALAYYADGSLPEDLQP